MKVRINGQEREVADGCTGRALLSMLQLGTERLAVERNGEILTRDQFAELILESSDRIEIVRFVGGG